MPDLSAYAANYRADGYKPRLYLSDMGGSSCLVGTVTANQGDGDLLIAYTTTSGNSANVRPGMRVTVRTSAGAYKGTLSVRYAGTITATSLPVREYSKGEVQVAVGDVFTVYEDLVLVDKLVSGEQADGTITFSPDYQTYTNQNDLYRPVTTSGSWGVCRLDASGNGDIAYQGNESWHVDPDSPSIPSPHLWSATGSPTFIVGSSSTQNVTLRWTTAGRYTITHTTTDASNATTWTQYVRARVHSDADPPMELSIDQVSGDAVNGFSFTVNVYENASFATLPDGMPVILWSEDTIDGGVTRGAKFVARSNIVASGFLRRDESFPNQSPNIVKFEIVSPLAMLSELPGFSKILQEVVSPDEWSEFTDLTTETAAVNLLRYYTNALDQFDYIRDQFSDDNYPRFELEKQSPVGQQNELATGRMGRVTVDRTGRFELQGELWAVDLGDRASVTKTFTFTTDDVLDGTMTLKRDHIRPLETFRLRGVSASTANSTVVNPVFARFPATPARGNQVIIQEKAIITDDGGVDLFAQCSKRAAWVNGVLFLSTGEQLTAPELSVQLPLVYARMFQNYREYFGFNFVAADSGGREIALSLFDWIFISITEDYQALTCTVNFRAATYAPPAASVDDTPKSETYIPPVNVTPELPPVTTPVVDPNGLRPGTGTIAAWTDDNELLITTNFNTPSTAGSPTWTETDVTGLAGWAAGTILDFCVDPFSPLYLGTGTTVNGWLLTTTRVYRVTDIFSRGAGIALTSVHTFSGNMDGAIKQIFTERGVQNWVLVTSYKHAVGVYVAYSTNGTSFTEVSVGTNYDTNAGNGVLVGAHISARAAGRIYISRYTSTATNAFLTTDDRASTDYGATFGALSTIAMATGSLVSPCIHVPYADLSETTVYYVNSNGAIVSYDPRLMRVVGTATPVDISLIGAKNYGVTYKRGFVTCDADQDTAILVGIDNFSGSGTVIVAFTRNARAASPTWQVLVADAAPGTNLYRAVYIAGGSRDTGYIIGDSAAIAYWGGGTTVDSRKGNISSTGLIVAICGG